MTTHSRDLLIIQEQREFWRAKNHGVTKSDTIRSDLTQTLSLGSSIQAFTQPTNAAALCPSQLGSLTAFQNVGEKWKGHAVSQHPWWGAVGILIILSFSG